MRCFIFLMAFLSGIAKNAGEKAIITRAMSLRACIARGGGRGGVRPAKDTLLAAMKRAWNARTADGGDNESSA